MDYFLFNFSGVQFHYTMSQIDKYQEFIESTAHLIMQFSQEGGFDNASGF